MSDSFPPRASEPEIRDYLVRFVGGTAAVTKVVGNGVSVAYAGTGIVTLTWVDNPGTFVGVTFGLQATTPADVKAFVPVAGAYSASTKSLVVRLYESGTLADLAALEWLTCRVAFTEG